MSRRRLDNVDDGDHWNDRDDWNLVVDDTGQAHLDGHTPVDRRPADPRRRITPDPTVDQRTIRLNKLTLGRQDRLRAQLNEVTVVSKTEARVGGVIVHLDPVTGVLSCEMHRGRDDCWHIAAVREQAVKRIQR
jgi:hypothetical protein